VTLRPCVSVEEVESSVNCPYCGTAIACPSCGAPVEEGAGPDLVITDGGRSAKAEAAAAPKSERMFLIVARGQGELLDQLKEVVGDLGWVRLMEDRRTDETILPREGREGTVHVDHDINP
jgi:hypothetical protein